MGSCSIIFDKNLPTFLPVFPANFKKTRTADVSAVNLQSVQIS